MPWAKLSDNLWSNGKIDSVGNEAAGVFTRMLSYCAQNSDGEVPENIVRYLEASTEALEKLTRAGLIRKRKDCWFIPSYPRLNWTKAQWEEHRRKRTESQRRWREKKAAESASDHPDDVDGLQDDLRDDFVRTGLRTGQEQGSKEVAVELAAGDENRNGTGPE